MKNHAPRRGKNYHTSYSADEIILIFVEFLANIKKNHPHKLSDRCHLEEYELKIALDKSKYAPRPKNHLINISSFRSHFCELFILDGVSILIQFSVNRAEKKLINKMKCQFKMDEVFL
jgi:hypothetical protein